jgi:hypothetical protein
MWNGYYIVAGIAGKGMSTGPGFSQQHIASIFS